MAGVRPATIARRLSVLRGTYRHFAAKGLIDWETSQNIAAVKALPVIKNSTPALTSKQAVKLLQEIPTSMLFRPTSADGLRLERRPMDRKTPWRLVKKYCRAAGINPDRFDGRGIGIHSLRKTAINVLFIHFDRAGDCDE